MLVCCSPIPSLKVMILNSRYRMTKWLKMNSAGEGKRSRCHFVQKKSVCNLLMTFQFGQYLLRPSHELAWARPMGWI